MSYLESMRKFGEDLSSQKPAKLVLAVQIILIMKNLEIHVILYYFVIIFYLFYIPC
jgi:hypothetical protein